MTLMNVDGLNLVIDSSLIASTIIDSSFSIGILRANANEKKAPIEVAAIS
jgi:hypothetical protein